MLSSLSIMQCPVFTDDLQSPCGHRMYRLQGHVGHHSPYWVIKYQEHEAEMKPQFEEHLWEATPSGTHTGAATSNTTHCLRKTASRCTVVKIVKCWRYLFTGQGVADSQFPPPLLSFGGSHVNWYVPMEYSLRVASLESPSWSHLSTTDTYPTVWKGLPENWQEQKIQIEFCFSSSGISHPLAQIYIS